MININPSTLSLDGHDHHVRIVCLRAVCKDILPTDLQADIQRAVAVSHRRTDSEEAFLTMRRRGSGKGVYSGFAYVGLLADFVNAGEMATIDGACGNIDGSAL